ncbi:MAG: DUF1972 domain-containing protein [Bacteroidales bacterium]|nr:DUF1972 domain-containing protein [Bacteroidales bacterium]
MILPILKVFFRKKIIVHIDGHEWTRDKWSRWAKLFLRISEKTAVINADAIIADHLKIKKYTSYVYQKKSVLIEYGGDHVLNNKIKYEKSFTGFEAGDYFLAVQRIEPENNAVLLIETFIKLKDQKLVIIGNWSNSRFGKKLKEKYSRYPNINLPEAIYDLAKLNSIRSNCFAYLHGHSCGGTNPSLVEAMFLGLPVFCFDNAFNRETTKNEAIYFQNQEDLEIKIRQSPANDLILTGKKMKNIAEVLYTWRIISDKYKDLFTSIIS